MGISFWRIGVVVSGSGVVILVVVLVMLAHIKKEVKLVGWSRWMFDSEVS